MVRMDSQPNRLTSERLDELMPLVYEQLRKLAARGLKRERPDHALQPTALVNEVYLKFRQQRRLDVHGRTHFLAVAAVAMRQILVDHARARMAAKRGGDAVRVTLDEATQLPSREAQDVLALDAALAKLAELDAQEAQIVELSFFGGLTQVEIANQLGVSERHVRGQWLHAQAWLRRELAD
jgi:RNA polymerase sigma factor (TIGR02999 family)